MFKKIGQTVLFYVVSIGLIILGFEAWPAGPCVPSPGMIFAAFIFGPLCGLLLFWNFYQSIIKGRKDYLPSMIIHGLMITAFCIAIEIG